MRYSIYRTGLIATFRSAIVLFWAFCALTIVRVASALMDPGVTITAIGAVSALGYGICIQVKLIVALFPHDHHGSRPSSYHY